VYDPIVMQRGFTTSTALRQWRALVASYKSGGGIGDGVAGGDSGGGYRKDLTIGLFDKGDYNASPVRTWTVHAAWPSDLATSDLNAEGSEILVETMTIVHEGLELTSSLLGQIFQAAGQVLGQVGGAVVGG